MMNDCDKNGAYVYFRFLCVWWQNGSTIYYECLHLLSFLSATIWKSIGFNKSLRLLSSQLKVERKLLLLWLLLDDISNLIVYIILKNDWLIRHSKWRSYDGNLCPKIKKPSRNVGDHFTCNKSYKKRII